MTLYNQAKARIETGAAKSVSEAARQLGNEMGRNPDTIRQRIKEGQLNKDVQLSELSGTDKHRPFVMHWTGDQESYTPEDYIEIVENLCLEHNIAFQTME